MKRDEAIIVLKDFNKQVTSKADGAYQSTIVKMACEVAVADLEEIQQYRALGTVQELREAMEKQTVKKVISRKSFVTIHNKCPTCGYNFSGSIPSKYCPNCGQALE